MMGVLKFQSLSVGLLLKLNDTAIARSNLMFLLHKFRPCLIKQMILIAFKKRSSQFWWMSTFKNRTLEPVSRFVALWWKHCIRFPRRSWLLRWIWHQALSSWVISLSTSCTCPLSSVLLLLLVSLKLWFFTYTVLRPAFFVILHLQDPSLQCFQLNHHRSVSSIGRGASRH